MNETLAMFFPATAMATLLSVCGLYIVVFGLDFLSYLHLKSRYSYVSRRTWLLFFMGQVAIIWTYFPTFAMYYANAGTELVLVGLLALFLFLFAYVLMKDQVYVCHDSTRSLRCLTPSYVFVKGAEIVFQQLSYLVIAHALVALLGLNMASYICFMFILMLIHVVVILGGGQRVIRSLTFGIFAITVPIYYIFMEMQLIWPAIYLHSVMYVFYWLVFADFDVQ